MLALLGAALTAGCAMPPIRVAPPRSGIMSVPVRDARADEEAAGAGSLEAVRAALAASSRDPRDDGAPRPVYAPEALHRARVDFAREALVDMNERKRLRELEERQAAREADEDP
jgi:hypothetical protein